MGVDLLNPGLLATAVHWGGFKWTGSFSTVDLIAASTNTLNGALLARRPDHYMQFTIVGILLMALDGRPLLGHWLKGKSRRELRDLGRTVPGTDAEPATQTERR